MTADEEKRLNAYLDGELDAREEEAFEILLLQRPDIAERVDADTLLRMAFKDYARSLPVEPITLAQTHAAERVVVPPRRRRVALALAASALIAVGVAGGRYTASRSAQHATPVMIAYVDTLRGSTSAPPVTLPENGALVLMAPVSSPQPCLATLTLDQAGSQVASAQAQSDAMGYAGLLVDSAKVREGAATIAVACAGKPVARYPMNLQRLALISQPAEAMHQS